MTEVQDQVLDALPKNGHPITYNDLRKKLPDVDPAVLSRSLAGLFGKGQAQIIHGRGWKLVTKRKS